MLNCVENKVGQLYGKVLNWFLIRLGQLNGKVIDWVVKEWDSYEVRY